MKFLAPIFAAFLALCAPAFATVSTLQTAHFDTRVALAHASVSNFAAGDPAYIEESGQQGFFQWSAADQSAAITSQGAQVGTIYVAPDSDPTGAGGAWVRVLGLASRVTSTATGNIAATNVDSAIAELEAEKQPLDSDLTALAALTTPATTLGNLVSPTYITETANSTLSGEFALGSLATGILKNTTTTGVPSIAAAGTDYIAPGGALGTPSSGTATNITGLPIAGITGIGTGVGTLLAGTPSGTSGLAGTASPTFTGTVTTAAITASGVITGSGGAAITNPQFTAYNNAQASIADNSETVVQWATEQNDVGAKFASNEWCPAWTGGVFLHAQILSVTPSVTFTVGGTIQLFIQKGTTGAETVFLGGPRAQAAVTGAGPGTSVSLFDIATSTDCYRVSTVIDVTSGTSTIVANGSFMGRAF